MKRTVLFLAAAAGTVLVTWWFGRVSSPAATWHPVVARWAPDTVARSSTGRWSR